MDAAVALMRAELRPEIWAVVWSCVYYPRGDWTSTIEHHRCCERISELRCAMANDTRCPLQLTVQQAELMRYTCDGQRLATMSVVNARDDDHTDRHTLVRNLVNGVLHSTDDRPAYAIGGLRSTLYGTAVLQAWCMFGQWHRDNDMPARIVASNGTIRLAEWRVDGLLHRDGGHPASIAYMPSLYAAVIRTLGTTEENRELLLDRVEQKYDDNGATWYERGCKVDSFSASYAIGPAHVATVAKRCPTTGLKYWVPFEPRVMTIAIGDAMQVFTSM